MQEVLAEEIRKNTEGDSQSVRKNDLKAYKKLLKRGYTEVAAKTPQEWWDVGHKLRKRMTGRIYTQKLVDRAEKIAMKYADDEQLKQFAYLREREARGDE